MTKLFAVFVTAAAMMGSPACSSSDAAEPSAEKFCVAYGKYFDESDRAEADRLLAEAEDVAPGDIAGQVAKVERLDEEERYKESQKVRDEIYRWRANNCADTSGAVTTTTAEPVSRPEAATLGWCDTWARYVALDRAGRSGEQGAELLARLPEGAPAEISARVERYVLDVGNGEDRSDLETDINDVWHGTCPGGVNSSLPG